MYLRWEEVDCVAAIGAGVFRVHGSAVHLFLCCEGNLMDLNYFKDILFDLINESDELEPDLLDIQCDDRNNTMRVIMKEGTVFLIQTSQETV